MWKVFWFGLIATALYARLYFMRAWRWIWGIKKRPLIVTKWRIVRAYAFREPPPGAGEAYDGDFMDVTDAGVDFSSDAWHEDMDDIIPRSWASWRLELRCQKGNKTKRRIVVRKNEQMYYPDEIQTTRRTRMSHRGILLAAILYSPSGDHIDITSKINKYVIHPGRKLLPRDIFPMDDAAALSERHGYIKVHVLRLDGSSVTRKLYFDNDDDDISELYS